MLCFNNAVKENKPGALEEARGNRRAPGIALIKQKRHFEHCKVKGETGKELWGGTVENVQALDAHLQFRGPRAPERKRQERRNRDGQKRGQQGIAVQFVTIAVLVGGTL